MKTLHKLIAIETGEEFELNQHKLSIGRDKNSDIVLRHGYPSRYHATLTIIGNVITLEDLGSTNGTCVNNIKIYKPTIVHEGDVIQFDSIGYHLVSNETEESTVLMKNLKPANAVEEESSVVIIGGFSTNDDTAVREAYPLPASWSLQDEGGIGSTQEIDRYPMQVIDGLIANNLPDKESLSAVLVVTSGKHETRLIGLSLNNKEQLWTIGRSGRHPIVLTDASISSTHACVFYNQGRWGISDERSKNGTAVNDITINESPLMSSDKITLGQVNLVFRILAH
ncbi:FHA domain-containing protein [Oceanicoccus sagamiensis]|uniref:FHA domain-containing protein n=1 Tax=Oceanicoccus sagamiensis TaxID=716816 RepID=A0A1X9NFI7_9GAMM|nr:FHA domain-containing protein [Oceanicoccus sagamiensis]ARN75804.1 hypothetical protein BST96_17835 [Oceanicoccus sagamiensis]